MLIYKGIFTYFFFALAISWATFRAVARSGSRFRFVEDAGRRRSVSAASKSEAGRKPVLTEGIHRYFLRFPAAERCILQILGRARQSP